jgi:hypothetical protein
VLPTRLPRLDCSSNRSLLVLLSLAVSVGSAGADGKAPDLTKLPAPATSKVDFARDIQPILAKTCVNCHGASKQKGGLRLDSAPELTKGGNSGAAFKAGDSLHSRIILAVSGLDEELKMPPQGKGLTAAEVGILRAWIDQGANWPKGLVIAPAETDPRLKHWAFQPVKRPKLPTVANKAWVRNPIDAFVLARLESEKTSPSPEADRVTLIRRLTLDLLGLIPTPAEVDAFVNDKDPEAYEKLVDRLLSSPHYGERWGRHWLDAARYADSDGYEKDTGRPFAWRWRNWVIDALNRDLPFDQFTIEQLAGDLLPNATTEQKVATGFHRNTLTNREGGVDQEQFRVEAVVDRVNTTARVFLGVTMNCCQCHDHKYDPFSQREFYQFFAFFDSDAERDIPASPPGQEAADEKRKAEFDKKTAELQAAVAAAKKELPARQAAWEAGLKLGDLRKLPADIVAALLLEPAKRDEKHTAALKQLYAKTDITIAERTKALAEHQRKGPGVVLAQTLVRGTTRKTHVMIRGDFLRKGAEVQPGTPGALPHSSAAMSNRLDLARWIVAPENPLTSRVLVNWVWQRYFGRGLVATPEDFGTQGERPSHPELLDWLASECMQQKWSLKNLHKTIVMSATYRQTSKVRPELSSRDPLNVLLARQYRGRLEAEVLRDVSLTASGLLSPKVGGPSVRPPQPAGISELTYAGSARWVESTGSDRYRRGIYTWFQRTSPYPMLLTFDAPDSNVCCVRRERSNTPLQALTLLNDTVFFECAQALGRRIAAEKSGSSADRIRYAFRVCLAREPSPRELDRLSRLHTELLENARANPPEAAKLAGKDLPTGASATEVAAWVALGRALMNLDEFVTRE